MLHIPFSAGNILQSTQITCRESRAEADSVHSETETLLKRSLCLYQMKFNDE